MTPAVDASRLRELLRDSLALWGVAGSVEEAAEPVVAAVTAQGVEIRVERVTGDDMPFRWMVHSKRGPPHAGSDRERPCKSVAGILTAMRIALDVDRGSPVRVAPGPAGT